MPNKHEYIIFLKIMPLQEDLYVCFLNSLIADDAKEYGYNENVLSLITMLRKIINHPDLVYEKEPDSKALHKDWVRAMNLFPVDYKNTSNRVEFSSKLMFVMEISKICMTKGEKLIVVSNFTKTLDVIERYYKALGYANLRLDGKTPLDQRLKLVNSFNEAYNPMILLLSSKTGGCGLNLIGASRLILFDADWNPSNDKQAMARI